MGTFGSVIIYGAPVAGNHEPAAIAARTAEALELVGLLKQGTAAKARIDQEPTFVTEGAVESGVVPAHASVDPADLAPAIGTLVYAATEAEFWGETQPDRSSEMAVPFVDITAFAEPISIETDDGEIRMSLVLEFSYEDTRLDYDKIHFVKDDNHPLFMELKRVFGTAFAWSVVSG